MKENKHSASIFLAVLFAALLALIFDHGQSKIRKVAGHTMVLIPGEKYYIGKTEVTQKQWENVMGRNPSKSKGANLPVENVSWDDCQEFLKKFNKLRKVRKSGLVFRLPSGEEWEYACRAGATGAYCKVKSGREITMETLNKVAWYDDGSDGTPHTHTVGKREPNAFGLYDMHGNVREWTQTAIPNGWGTGLEEFGTRGGSFVGWRTECEASIPTNFYNIGFGDGDKWRMRHDHLSSTVGFRLCAVDSKVVAKRKSAVAREILGDMIPIPGKRYRMGKTEVTQAQWETIMLDNSFRIKDSNSPMRNINVGACQEFLKKFNEIPEVKKAGLVFRLPSEEEWEYACRAGATGKFCKLADGTEITEDTLGRVAWYNDNSGDATHTVGQKEPNAFGLYDMHGNVFEWTQTEVNGRFLYCGGGWFDSARHCDSSFRLSGPPDQCLGVGSIGFRLCAEKR